VAKFLITGHTGFKGSWLTLLLKAGGHEVSGYSDKALSDTLFARARISRDMEHDLRGDVRNLGELKTAFQTVRPDFVIHLAAQSLVREGYRLPVETYETNFLGTLNVLQASAQTPSIRSQLIVTSDKVYASRPHPGGYQESDPLGGNDPYSSSKAATDVLAQEWLKSGRTKPGAIVRAGNVVGAGDVSRDRLLPDIVRACKTGSEVRIRYPNASRPWQHVLDCLNAYVLLVERMDLGLVPENEVWNIGPRDANTVRVSEVIRLVTLHLRSTAPNFVFEDSELHEDGDLHLNTSKSSSLLGAPQHWSLNEAVLDSVAEVLAPGRWGARAHMLEQISRLS